MATLRKFENATSSLVDGRHQARGARDAKVGEATRCIRGVSRQPRGHLAQDGRLHVRERNLLIGTSRKIVQGRRAVRISASEYKGTGIDLKIPSTASLFKGG